MQHDCSEEEKWFLLLRRTAGLGGLGGGCSDTTVEAEKIRNEKKISRAKERSGESEEEQNSPTQQDQVIAYF